MMSRQEPPRALFAAALSAPAARAVLAFCRDAGWCASCCFASGPSMASPADAEQERRLREFEELEGTVQQRVADLGEALAGGGPPLKVVAMVPDPEAAAAAARAALPAELVHIIAAEVHIEFISPEVSKGQAVARLCGDVLGIPLAEVLAFGDNSNDLEMLRLVGEGVAMANAKEAVKSAADRVCAWTNDEEGVARELEALDALVGRAPGAPVPGGRL
uniref:Uncharacterized protein n=1 Tax=Zooxanthella nutricula TaxID=1333877 RepID=A0A7S2PTM5_9DINO